MKRAGLFFAWTLGVAHRSLPLYCNNGITRDKFPWLSLYPG
jgi:hypothetical protein